MQIALLIIIGILMLIIYHKNRMIKIKQIEKELERNKAVYWFRRYCNKIRPDVYKTLPTYEEMLNSDTPITEESYFPEHKTI